MTSGSETVWFAALFTEAERDVVFAFNIVAGAFNGPGAASVEEAPGRLERAARALLAHGCIVGFGDPDSKDWLVPENLRLSNEQLPCVIAKLFSEKPLEYGFLAFAYRKGGLGHA